MTESILLTFGCSWTYGVGVGYEAGMTLDDYKKVAWDRAICDSYSFRGILAKKYGYKNINFSQGASSNQKQFRLLKTFLTTDIGKEIVQSGNVLILHGITSTARNELYLNTRGELVNFKYDSNESDLARVCKFIVNNLYDHNNELDRLTEEMQFINEYYDALGVKRVWFDTFNHHDYKSIIYNFLHQESPHRDLLSTLATKCGMTSYDVNYHKSSWVIDTDRVRYLINHGYLNPISMHPTRLGHEKIAEMFVEHIDRII